MSLRPSFYDDVKFLTRVFFSLAALLSAQLCFTGCKNDSPQNPCGEITCSGHGTCILINEEPVCECDDGYIADGLMCISEAAFSTQMIPTGSDVFHNFMAVIQTTGITEVDS